MRFLSRTAKYGNILEGHAHRFGKTCDAYIYLLLHQSDSDQMTDARHKDNRPLRSVNFNVARPMSFTWEWINEQAPPTENHCDVCVVCQRNFRLQKGAKGNMSNTWHVEMFYSRRAIFKLKKNFREFFVGNKKGQLWSLTRGKNVWHAPVMQMDGNVGRLIFWEGGHQELLTSLMTAALIIIIVKKKVYKNYDVATPHFIDFTTATPEIDGALIASSVLNNQVIRWKWAKMKESISTLIDGTRWLL